MSKIALITGASSGIGKSTALELNKKGFIVYGAARRQEKLHDLELQGIKTILLDVTNENSMIDCIEKIVKTEGRIDILINNAGYGSYGAVEDVPMEEARKQLEVNIFGLARLTQLVLPYMRENKFGKIVNISSVGGRVWTPFGAWYHATKHALEGFSASLRLEVARFGIDVILIEPGGIKTDWGFIAADNLEKNSQDGAYKDAATSTGKTMRKMYHGNLTPPEVIAKCIGKAVTVRKPKTRYLLGYMAKPAILIQKWCGDKIYDSLLRIMYKI